MKETKLIIQQLAADRDIRAFLLHSASAWDLQLALADLIDNMSAEELDCGGTYPNTGKIIKKIEDITELGDLSKFGSDFYAAIASCVFVLGPDAEELETTWQEDIVEWVNDVHQSLEEKKKKVELIVDGDGEAIDITEYIRGLREACDNGIWMAEEDLESMEKNGCIDKDQAAMDEEVIKACEFFSSVTCRGFGE